MTITFRYKEVKRPDSSAVKIPAIPITLIGDKGSFDTVALIDSGADISVIPKDIAEILGLNLKGDITDAFGIGGSARTIETKIRVIISKGHERYQLQLPIKVILGKYDFPVLLGREGFFDKFKIIFDQQKEKISLKRKSRKLFLS